MGLFYVVEEKKGETRRKDVIIIGVLFFLGLIKIK
jgi:hypothetical protein